MAAAAASELNSRVPSPPALPPRASPQEEQALAPAPLAALHAHRRVLGVIGVMHCPSVADISKALAQFEQRCK